MKTGDLVTWLFVPRGGYGHSMPVNAKIVGLHTKHATIEVKTRSGDLVRRKVLRASLRERPARSREPLCRYCGCPLAGISEVTPGSGVYDRSCHARDGDMCERTGGPR
jgi:hypothetical protein